MAMTNNYKKKLIEVAIPLEAINTASAREKSIRHGHPSTLHLWWARRPLAACRAVLFAQLVDDPSSYVDKLLEDPKIRATAEKELAERITLWKKRQSEPESTAASIPEPTLEDCAADIERKRLFEIIEDLVIWENSTNEEVLERARAEIRRSCIGELPPIYDPFSGGGSIPLEAQRLGLPAYGSDLNPVAVMIGKAMIEIPSKFKDQSPIHPGAKERNHYRNAEGLAEDVKFYGDWMREKAFERIGHLYPQVDLPREQGGGKATVIAWFWSRTVPSPDPAFSDVHVPIASSFLLCSKKGKEAWVEPVVDKVQKIITYRIRNGGTKGEIARANEGTKVGRANFRCIISDTAITANYIKEMGQAGHMSQVLIAIATLGHRRRVYTAPNELHISTASSLSSKDIAKHCRETFLSGETPERLTGGTCYSYGLNQWGKLFSNRQLAALSTFSDLVHEARNEIERDAISAGLPDDGLLLRRGGTGARAYAEAVSVYISFAADRAADAWSSQVSWRNSVEASRSTFARQAFPMIWDFVELNPFSSSNGNWNDAAIEWVSKSLAAFCPEVTGQIVQADAQTVMIQKDALISTDPPYYDNIAYADLSDFFYVWLRRHVADVFPELTNTLAVPKAEELVATAYRHGGRDSAEAFFLKGMKEAIANMARQAASEYPATIYYAFKQSEIEEQGVTSTGWATFIQAIIDAGYSILATWPLRTEKPGRMIAVGTNALANSVVLVCRKKEPSAEIITRAEFIRILKRELPPAIAELQAANITPADMPQSAIGPGMGVFSRYQAVLEADDSPMSVKTALQHINHELDEYIGGIVGEFDADTRFAITWFEQHGMKAGDYGIANSIAQARGISVESVKHAGIVDSSAGSVRILKREELESDWEPATDTHLTVWECLQYLVRQHEQNGISYETALLLKQIGDKGEAVKDLAYCLYDISANKRKEASEATAYNALIADWTELTRESATIQEISGDGQAEMNF
jgi:putative DNA methylase